MGSPDLPKEMKAQLLKAYNEPYSLESVPVPTMSSPNDIIIKVEAASYCHTDAMVAAGKNKVSPPKLPHIGCHEFAGTVVALNSSPSEAARDFQIGSRVGSPGRGFGSCGECFECRTSSNETPGYSFFCQKTLSNGMSKNGGFAEYAVVDARQCVRIPDNMKSVDAAPLMCAGVTIFNAIKNCNLVAGQRLGIIGCGGGLGHLGLQFADAMGLRVIGVDAADGSLSLAKSLGTKARIVDARSIPVESALDDIGKEDQRLEVDKADTGLDAVIILPEGQAGFDYGIKLLRSHGLCVVVSIPVEGFRVSTFDLVYRDIKVRGSILGTHSTLRETVDFAAQNNVRSVSKTYPLEKLNEAAEEHQAGFGGKLVIDLCS